MPFDRRKYPTNWIEISNYIRFTRALGQCEWIEDNGERCKAQHLNPSPRSGSKVVLTTAHLEDEDPMNCDYSNLAALCQAHHLGYDSARRRIKLFILKLLIRIGR